MKTSQVSPCCRCSKVDHPDLCNDAKCTLWQNWFVQSWNAMRCACRQQMEETPMSPLGVPLGGFYYAPPHLLRQYRQTDPCKGCKLRVFCQEKCKLRNLWEQQGGIQ